MSAARRTQTGPEPLAEEDGEVWRALGDPTRRALLDRLRGGAATTGALAEGFAMTRFGVMKHLRVLVDAGLVVVVERGRERVHHLNPVPIRRLSERWLRPFTEAAALGLEALRDAVEGDGADRAPRSGRRSPKKSATRNDRQPRGARTRT